MIWYVLAEKLHVQCGAHDDDLKAGVERHCPLGQCHDGVRVGRPFVRLIQDEMGATQQLENNSLH